jgi:hypothetical protein
VTGIWILDRHPLDVQCQRKMLRSTSRRSRTLKPRLRMNSRNPNRRQRIRCSDHQGSLGGLTGAEVPKKLKAVGVQTAEDHWELEGGTCRWVMKTSGRTGEFQSFCDLAEVHLRSLITARESVNMNLAVLITQNGPKSTAAE